MGIIISDRRNVVLKSNPEVEVTESIYADYIKIYLRLKVIFYV